jgi:hypothetical protein
MIVNFLLLLLVLVGIVLALAATRPDRFAVVRETQIAAPPDRIHPLIADLRQWMDWSPYEGKDPAMRRSFGQITAGPGASYAWDGNSQVGQGSMSISASDPPRSVTLQLHFIKPFEGRNEVVFRLEPLDGVTRVVWDMHGPAPFANRLMGLFLNLDRMIGRDFEIGLAKLKDLVEARARAS